MADKIFLFAKRVMKQSMSKMYAAPLSHDHADMDDHHYACLSGAMSMHRKNARKAMKMSVKSETGYAWPKQWSQRSAFFCIEKLLSA